MAALVTKLGGELTVGVRVEGWRWGRGPPTNLSGDDFPERDTVEPLGREGKTEHHESREEGRDTHDGSTTGTISS